MTSKLALVDRSRNRRQLVNAIGRRAGFCAAGAPRRRSGTLERLQLAGYARFQPDGSPRAELTEHARKWIETIWAPLRREGGRRLDRYETLHLAVISGFLQHACANQEARTTRPRGWLKTPASPARRAHLLGGLSPVALRRVQVFVEANLGRAIHLPDLAARAALSSFHFARAFKTSVGMTPRAFIEHRTGFTPAVYRRGHH